MLYVFPTIELNLKYANRVFGNARILSCTRLSVLAIILSSRYPLVHSTTWCAIDSSWATSPVTANWCKRVAVLAEGEWCVVCCYSTLNHCPVGVIRLLVHPRLLLVASRLILSVISAWKVFSAGDLGIWLVPWDSSPLELLLVLLPVVSSLWILTLTLIIVQIYLWINLCLLIGNWCLILDIGCSVISHVLELILNQLNLLVCQSEAFPIHQALDGC